MQTTLGIGVGLLRNSGLTGEACQFVPQMLMVKGVAQLMEIVQRF